MDTKEQLDALQDIRKMMNRSVRFLSLSGLSGLFAGIYAILAGLIAYLYLGKLEYFTPDGKTDRVVLVMIAVVTLILALLTAFLLSLRKARHAGVKMWDESAKNAILNLCIPLLTGGIFSLALIHEGIIGLVAPTTLIFYGLALVNTSKYTFPTIRQLGFLEIGLGLINAFFIGYGLIFWVAGFGLFHVIYGIYMYFKYDRV
ncbi:MAG: hypothetical protein JW801_14210 [Bacteroidales bacterium]|nr:hypothetical protein [Bacteroidales bacterium]